MKRESGFSILKNKLEEARRMKEVVTSQLKENEKYCERLESEIVSLRIISKRKMIS